MIKPGRTLELLNRVEYAESELHKIDNQNINFTDPEARYRPNKDKKWEFGYIEEVANDAKYNITIAKRVTQDANDQKQLIPMIEKALETIKKIKKLTTEELNEQLSDINHVFDNGFLTFENLATIKERLYNVFMPTNEQAREFKIKYTGKEVKPFSINNFKYEPVFDFFICPEKQILKYTNDIIVNDIPKKSYTGAPCNECPSRKECCNNKYRQIQKTNNQDLKEQEKKMETEEAQEIYELRNKIENNFAYLQTILKHIQYQTIGLKNADKELTQNIVARNLRIIFNLIQQKT